MVHFKTISEFCRAEGFPLPEHTLFNMGVLPKDLRPLKKTEVTCDFYFVGYKKMESGEFLYGKTKCDHDLGSMFYIKPRQIITLDTIKLKEDGFIIHFHEDLVFGHSLFSEMKNYNFFDYESNAVLHLSTAVRRHRFNERRPGGVE